MVVLRTSLVAAFLAVWLVNVNAQTTDSRSSFERAVALQQRGDTTQAIEQYRELLKTKPDLLPAWINLGVALAQAGKFGEAIESYRSALALNPNNGKVQFYMALAYFKKGDAASASREFAKLLKDNPGDLRVATLLSASYLEAGDNPHALSVLTPLVSVGKDNPDFQWAYGSAMIANGNLAEGVQAVEQVAKARNAAQALMLAGQTWLRLNDFVRAKDDLEAAARVNPTLPGVQAALGHARENNADYQGAVAAFSKAVEQNPADAGAWLGLGGDQYFQRELDGARSSLERALILDPDSAPALYALALVEKAQSHPQPAAVDLEQAVKIRPDWMEAHVELAALYFQLHRTADGARERKIVDRLSEEQRKAGPSSF